MRSLYLGFVLSLGLSCAHAEVPAASTNPPELGDVAWERDFDAARERARVSGKPLLILFDEVPGCSTVVAYGNGTLSHPLLVDAAQTLFVPVLVRNNVPGVEREWLTHFGEPVWNNPVVRIVDPQTLTDVVPRLTDRTDSALATAMMASLGTQTPEWLALVAQEMAVPTTQTATYGMYCFWSGEQAFGRIDGVVATQTGFADGREAVKVTFDPSRVTKAELDAAATRAQARPLSGALRPSQRDDVYSLRRTAWAAVPMTAAQATRANATLRDGGDPGRWFSPAQHALAAQGGPVANLGRGDIVASWATR